MSYTRRDALKTLGIASAACACGGSGGPTEGVATMCGSNLCVSIAANPELGEVGTGLLFVQGPHKIYVVRTSATGFSTVSAICTHQNCTIEWDGSSTFNCPCHDSKFTAEGAVTKGPAIRALRVYTHMLDGDTLTISLT